jgi:hypothetical protein
MSYLHAVHERTLDEADRIELAEARRLYLSALAEVQIMAPDEVLASAEVIMNHLSSAYDAIKALERGNPKPGRSFEAVRDGLMSVWDVWHTMRRIIRVDLGLEQADPAAEPVLPTAPAVTPAGERSPNA